MTMPVLVTPALLERQEKALEKRIADYLQQMEEADRQEARTEIDRQALKEALQLLNDRRADVQATRALMAELGLSQLVATEPDARDMRTAQGQRVAYNTQTAVDGRHGLIIHHEVTQAGSDNTLLEPMAKAAMAVLEQEALTVVADAGYSNLTQFQHCEDAGITPYVPPNRSVNPREDGRLFDRSRFDYDAERDEYRCPAGQRLVLKQRNAHDRNRIYAANAADCASCPLKAPCTKAERRYVSRHENEVAGERMAARMAMAPEKMVARRSLVEHPYAVLKYWIMGHGRLLMRGLRGAGAEMALAVNVFNLKRAINILGVAGLREKLLSTA